MAAETVTSPDVLTDREILADIHSKVLEMWTVFERFRPMLETRDGRPDMIGVFQARREARRAARGGP